MDVGSEGSFRIEQSTDPARWPFACVVDDVGDEHPAATLYDVGEWGWLVIRARAFIGRSRERLPVPQLVPGAFQ